MITSQVLRQFGLSDKDAKVYLANLKLGMDSVQNIAKEANIHRVSAYDVLNSLADKGYVGQSVKGKKRYFVPTDPDRILDKLKNQSVRFASLVPELKAIQNKGTQWPRIMYYEGKEAVWQAYQDRIKHMSDLKENLVYGSSEKLLSFFSEEYKKFTKDRLAKEIKARIIVEKSKYGQLEADTASKQLREVKFLPEAVSFEASTIIYGNRVMTVSWDTMLLVIVEDKNSADTQRTLFNLLWQTL